MDSSHLHGRLQRFVSTAPRPLVVLLGPTASGKTAFSITLARQIGRVEVVNADSRQLYRFLDIGTAKITREEMRGVPHHLLDVLNPEEEATAGWYKEAAEDAIRSIQERHHIPMLIGGSMLYISAVTDALEFPTDPRRRKSLQARKAMKPRDDLFIIGIDRPHQELMQRINQRTEELFNKGWVQEVRNLLKRGYTANDPAMKSHGYREIMEWLRHGERRRTMTQLQDLISAKTRQYAKRQLTWWRGDPRIHWTTP